MRSSKLIDGIGVGRQRPEEVRRQFQSQEPDTEHAMVSAVFHSPIVSSRGWHCYQNRSCSGAALCARCKPEASAISKTGMAESQRRPVTTGVAWSLTVLPPVFGLGIAGRHLGAGEHRDGQFHPEPTGDLAAGRGHL